MLKRGYHWFVIGFVAALLAGWIVFPAVLYKSAEQPLQFSHKVHSVDAAGLQCADCHQFRPDGQFGGIPGIAKCAECHAEAIGSSPHERTLVDQYVKKGREIPWLVYARQPQNVYFSHDQHVNAGGLKCEDCHGPHGTSDTLRPFEVDRVSGYSRDVWGSSIARFKKASWDGNKMDDCADCHRQRNVANTCMKCHQ